MGCRTTAFSDFLVLELIKDCRGGRRKVLMWLPEGSMFARKRKTLRGTDLYVEFLELLLFQHQTSFFSHYVVILVPEQ